MAVYLITTIKRFIGESFDTKPTTGVPPGSTFFETDTKNNSIYTGAAWTFTAGDPVFAVRATQRIAITEEEEEFETAYIVGGPVQRLAMAEALSIVSSLQERDAADQYKHTDVPTLLLSDFINSSGGIAIVDEGAISVTE